ncbi:hypothetical protein [Anaerobutyricum soehngenii]
MCGRFYLNDDGVASYVNRMKVNSRIQIDMCGLQG